jgi:glutathione S-transferase kappa 1
VLFYDCLSPFSYFAFTVLSRYKSVWGVELTLKPVLLGGIMASTKNLPPMARPWAPSTAKVGAQDMLRNKGWFNVPHMLDVPSNFFGPDGPADKR